MNLVDEEKQAALADPGPSWREWFLFDASRWWMGLLLLIVDSWIVAIWIGYANWVGLGVSLGAALYAEFLFWEYLWYRPHGDWSLSTGGFQRKWYRPVPYGRWTPESEAVRSGVALPTASGPDPREFL